ncbi:dienelactone hydrolase family protein [Blastococcus sp. URHD0036]|uniref:dienelactone hydrolase family protein n=1 Tax=Blastococcus sp. URHD0036 TaxID=1380356 RepID=UPI0004955C6B|nr:dienelactone hydrolase family protein [Blastococcus sp. URHD0036]
MENPVQNVSFPSGGGEAFGYLATPEAGSGPGVIVIQEWWGLTTHIADIADRLAKAGFVALAPDLYGGPTTHDAAEAMEMAKKLPPARAAQALAGAVDHLLALPQVSSSTAGVVGFCMGGGFVLSLAGLQGGRVSAAVPFYGLPHDLQVPAGLQCAVQGHFGEQDQMVPLPNVRKFFDRLSTGTTGPVELHVYPAGHAFVNDENLIGTHDPDSAALAWDRAVSFLREHVRG